MRAVMFFSKSLRLTLVQFSMSVTSVFKKINWTGGQILPLISFYPKIINPFWFIQTGIGCTLPLGKHDKIQCSTGLFTYNVTSVQCTLEDLLPLIYSKFPCKRRRNDGLERQSGQRCKYHSIWQQQS